MRVPTPWIAVAAAAAVAIASAWWALRPRPTLDGVVGLIDSGRYQRAEARLREFLATNPEDRTGRVLLARVLVNRPEPDPGKALTLVDGLHPADGHLEAVARSIEGDAYFWSGRYDRAEPAWLEALRVEPTLPEVGWKLLNVYALQGRQEDSRLLALRLFAIEPDERDRVQLLLQSIRHDAHPIEAGSIVHSLEPIVRENPGDFRSASALGLGMIGVGRADEGLELLRAAAGSHGEDVAAKAAYFEGLMSTGGLDELTRALHGLPGSIADSPHFEVARGWVASQARDLDAAIRSYRRALDARPVPAALASTALAHRLKGLLRQANRADVLRELEPRLEAIIRFPILARGYYDRLNELPDLGLKTSPGDFRELAAALAIVGRVEEANAWELLAGGPAGRTP